MVETLPDSTTFPVMNWLLKLLLLALLLGVALQAYARWPRDFSDKHRAVEMPEAGDGLWVISTGARVSVTVPQGPVAALGDFETAILSLPRTVRVAGGPEEGHATYVTRSALWGFPDLTTVEAVTEAGGTRLNLWGRLQMGKYDLGVNRDRILGLLTGLGIAPPEDRTDSP